MRVSIALWIVGIVAGCSSSPPPPPETSTGEPGLPENEAPADEPLPVDAPLPVDERADRPTMTVDECEAKGQVMGDPGDGSTHRPDYRCPNGSEPIGTVPSGIEGAVCCEG